MKMGVELAEIENQWESRGVVKYEVKNEDVLTECRIMEFKNQRKVGGVVRMGVEKLVSDRRRKWVGMGSSDAIA